MIIPVTMHRLFLPGRRLWPTLAAIACAVALGAAARAEDDRVVDEVPAIAVPEGQQHSVDLGVQFDANLCSQVGLPVDHQRPRAAGAVVGESPLLAFAKKQGDARLAKIEAICSLSASQQRKLRVAIDADVRRLMEDVEPIRRKYQGVKVTFNDQRWRESQQEMQRCVERVRGLFDADSLLEKSLPTTLDDAQRDRLTAENEARRATRWRGLVAQTLVRFDDLLGLDQRQYDLLEAMLVAQRPRLRLDVSGEFSTEQMIVPMVLAGVDAQQLRAILSERQRQALAQQVTHAKQWRQMLEARGLLEKENK